MIFSKYATLALAALSAGTGRAVLTTELGATKLINKESGRMLASNQQAPGTDTFLGFSPSDPLFQWDIIHDSEHDYHAIYNPARDLYVSVELDGQIKFSIGSGALS